jgi:hypothetical protein
MDSGDLASDIKCARALRTVPFALVAFLALAVAAPLHAQVYKCVDTSGRTTYQQAPCKGAQQGRELQMQPDNGSTRGPGTTAAWSAAVAEHRVVVGMPKQWAVEALGAPAERRAARSGESATEVWVYMYPTEAMRVGFVADAVAWTIKDAVQSPTADDPEKMRRIAARQKVAAGRDCTQVLAELGPPDREEPASDVDQKTGLPRGPLTTRYVYQPGAGDPQTRTSFTCIDNHVIDVERTMVR